MMNELAQGNGAISTPHAAIICGHTFGPCVNGGRNTGQGIYTLITGCETTPGTAWEFWTVDLAREGAKSGVDLPGDQWVYLASNSRGQTGYSGPVARLGGRGGVRRNLH